MNKRTVRIAVCLTLLTLFMSCLSAQSYTTYSQSSNLGKENIDKASFVWVLCDTNSFMWNRTIETSVMNSLSKKGVDIQITSDYLDICSLSDDDYGKVVELIIESGADYLLALEMKDLFTYSVGGGITSMNITATLLNLNTGRDAIIIELYTEADTNDYKSLNATREPAVDSMAEMLTKEFIKYVK